LSEHWKTSTFRVSYYKANTNSYRTSLK